MSMRLVETTQQRFWRLVTRDGGAPCALANVEERCDGPRDAHHYFPKRRITWTLGKKHPRLDDALGDVRNGVCLCRRHHNMVERALNPLPCPRPPELTYFLADYDLYEEPVSRTTEAAGPDQ